MRFVAVILVFITLSFVIDADFVPAKNIRSWFGDLPQFGQLETPLKKSAKKYGTSQESINQALVSENAFRPSKPPQELFTLNDFAK